MEKLAMAVAAWYGASAGFLAATLVFLCSLYFFDTAIDPALILPMATSQYSGTVDVHDAQNNRIILHMASSFPLPETGTEKVAFVYDDQTAWYAFTYVIQDGIVERRETASKAPTSPLPKGALVSISRDIAPDSGKLRAENIYFLRRIEL